MKRWIRIGVISMLLSVGTPSILEAANPEDVIRVNISLNEDIDLAFLQELGVNIIHEFSTVSLVTAEVSNEQKSILSNDSRIKWIETDFPVKISSQQKDWGYVMMQPQHNEVKENRFTGKGVKIGVIDTGINSKHPDLKVAGGVSFVEDEPSYDDPNGHGTHVAGIIGALDNDIGIVGIAPNAQIYAIRSLASNGYGNQSDIVAGIDWAIKQNLDIINLSVTTSRGSATLKEVLQKAYNHGILIVAASGNSQEDLPVDTEVQFPARYEEVIAVGSIGKSQKRSSFSYFGNYLEFVAPGDGIFSTMNNSYGYSTGTSMAAPYIAGVAALYIERNNSLSNVQVRQLMQKEALDLGPLGRDREYGFGVVKAPTKPEVISPEPFADIEAGSWYEASVKELIEKKILSGYEDQTVRPNQFITRAEAVTLIARSFGINPIQTNTVFMDVTKIHFASGYINEGTNRLWLSGYPNGKFQPNNTITRGEVALVLKNAFEIAESDENPYPDVQQGAFYTPAMLGLAKMGVLTGYDDGSLRPNRPLTRAELSKMLVELL